MPSVGGRLPKFPCIYLVWFGGKCVHTAGHHSGGSTLLINILSWHTNHTRAATMATQA